jgi:hypothetical protein
MGGCVGWLRVADKGCEWGVSVRVIVKQNKRNQNKRNKRIKTK